MSDGLKYDVFISYKHDTEATTTMFFQLLEIKFGTDITHWRDRDIKAGTDWRRTIDVAIRDSRVVLVVITPDAVRSQYMTYEWCYALGMGKPVIPVLLKGTEDDVHLKLRDLQHFDFRTSPQPWEALLQRIRELSQDSMERTGKDVGSEVVSRLEQLTQGQTLNPLSADDVILTLMEFQIVSHDQVRRLQDLISDHNQAVASRRKGGA